MCYVCCNDLNISLICNKSFYHVKNWLKCAIYSTPVLREIFAVCVYQVSVTLENFQDISLPIPGKEDLAKLHSSTHQTSLVKAGSCGEAYAPQGWIAFVMEYIKRCAYNVNTVFIYTFTSGIRSSLDCSFFQNVPLVSVSIFSWFWGPVVTLQDCLAAFFARDELKGKQVGVKLFY